MGSHNSTSIQNYVEQSTSISSSVNQNIEVQSDTVAANYQINSNTINIGNPTTCCAAFTGATQLACVKGYSTPGFYAAKMSCGIGGLDIIQSGSMNIKVSKKVNAASNANLINGVMDQMNAEIGNFVKENNDSGVLSGVFSESNNAKISTIISNSLKDDLTVNLNQSIQSNLRSQSGQENFNNLNLCSGTISGSNCKMSQTFSYNLYTTNVLGAVANITAQNSAVQKLAAHIKNTTDQINTNWLSDLMNGITGIERVIMIAMGVAVLLGCLFAFVMIMRHRKSGHTGSTGVDYSRGKGHSSYQGMTSAKYRASLPSLNTLEPRLR